METIGARITILRKNFRLTQSALASKLNVSDKVLSKWECDECSPCIDDVCTLCDFFKVTTEYIVKGNITHQDKLVLERSLTSIELADDFIEQCYQIIKDRGLQKFKDILLPRKMTRFTQKNEEYVVGLSGGVFKGDNANEWRNPFTPYLDVKKLIALDDYDLYLKLIDLPATSNELREVLIKKNDQEGLKCLEEKRLGWDGDSVKKPLSADDIKGLTDIRFYKALDSEYSRSAALNPINKNYWVIVEDLIYFGAKVRTVKSFSENRQNIEFEDNNLLTQVVLAIAQMKNSKK